MDEILGKKIADLPEKADPVDTDVYVFGDVGSNVLKKTKWRKMLDAIAAKLTANNLTTNVAGFFLDARQGKALKDEVDELNTNLSNMESLMKRGHYQILSIQKVTLNTSGPVEPGKSAIVSATFTEVNGATSYEPVLRGMGWLTPQAPTISGNKISVSLMNIGTGAHSGSVYYTILALKQIRT